MLLLLLGCPTADVDGFDDWAIPPSDVGSPIVSGEGFDPDDGDTIGAAFAQWVPGFAEGQPAWDVPVAVWAIAMGELVADPGSCPYATLAGEVTEYRSECRSQDGYEWTGGGSSRAWEDDGVTRERFEFDVEVVGDVEGADFDSLTLRGTVERAESGETVHVDANLHVSLVDYFERRQLPDDPRRPAWEDWQVSGSTEAEGGTIRMEATADIGRSGALPARGTLDTTDSCPVEPTGTLAMGDAAEARFEGAEGCDACATIVSGDDSVAACAP